MTSSSTHFPHAIAPTNPVHHDDTLTSLTFHSSPPPSLAARLGKKASKVRLCKEVDGMDGDTEERSLPEHTRDPEAALVNFIDHLLNPDHAETEPHLMAVGYELEALVSIYSPSVVKLGITSRPTSWNHSFTPSDQPTQPLALPMDAEMDGGPIQGPSSVPMGSDMGSRAHRRRDSRAWTDAVEDDELGISPTERIRYEVTIPTWEDGEVLDGVGKEMMPNQAPKMRLMVSLPPTYPNSSPPQLQLLGRYLGSFAIDAGLFGDITRTYITASGVTFTPGDVCVFEGLTHVQSLARTWYATHLSEGIEGEKAREADRRQGKNGRAESDLADSEERLSPRTPPRPEPGFSSSYNPATTITTSISANYPSRPSPLRSTFSYTSADGGSEPPQSVRNAKSGLPSGLKIVSCEPIVDRKSSFVGHAVKITDEREVPLVIHELLSDKKIAKAAHPAIFAYRVVKNVGGAAAKVVNTDYDDDGESQAGARLKHLLEILDLENVLVVVTRWYGGTLLGPDRFKHVSQAARDALDLGGFLDGDKEGKDGKKGKKR